MHVECFLTKTHKPRSRLRVPRRTWKHPNVPQSNLTGEVQWASDKKKKSKRSSLEGKAGLHAPRRRLDSPVKWLAILAVGLGGRAGGCLRRDSCFTGVSSWSPEKAAGFLGGSSRTGLAEGSWDRRTPDSLAEGLSSDTEGTTTRHTGDITQTQCGGAGGSTQDGGVG